MSDGIEPLLAELSADEYWRREQALRRLRQAPPSTDLLSSLSEALGDPEGADRRNAARSALAGLAGPGAAKPASALATLTQLVESSPDSDVRLLAAAALGESENPECRPVLERALDDPDPNVAAGAAEALGMLGDPRAVDALHRASRSGPFWVRAAAIAALGKVGGEAAVESLRAAAEDDEMGALVASALGSVALPSGLPTLQSILDRKPAEADAVLEAAAELLAANPGLPVPEWLREAAAEREAWLSANFRESGEPAAARLLGAAGTPTSAAELVRALREGGPDDPAVLGIALLPAQVGAQALLAALRRADPRERVPLINALPPLPDTTAARQVADHLSDPAEDVQAAAAEALGRSAPEIVLPTLREAIGQPGTRLAAVRAYGRLGQARCEPLEPLLTDVEPQVRAAAAEGLARCGRSYSEPIRLALKDESDPEARVTLVRALGTAGGPEAATELAPLLATSDPVLRFAVIDALGRSGAPEAYLPLLEGLVDPRPEIQAAALHALGELGDPRGAAALTERLEHASRDLRRTAAFALDRLAPEGAAERLAVALDDPDREVRLTAVRLLSRLGDGAVLSKLEAVADRDADPLVRRAACDAADEVRRRLQEAG